MGREEQIINERKRKLEEIKELGINPFPANSEKKQTCEECLKIKIGREVITAGRLMTKRDLGKIAFSVLKDGTGEIQIVLQDGETDNEKRKFFKKYLDAGDFVEVKGKVFKTKTEQISILVSDIKILTKSILPLPEKFHGIKNEEERFRKRYLDILTDNSIREMLLKKTKFWKVTRDFMEKKGFVEVDTPVLEVTTGGADARPFITHHNDFDIDVYLRISVGELWQKRLMAAGFEKTFEIGKVFRNEGSSPEHLQEFTNMEFYWAYANYKDGMNLTKELYREIAKEVFETTKFESKGHTFDLADEWIEIDYQKHILEKTGIDILNTDVDEMKDKLKELNVKYGEENKERLIDSLWKYCRKDISGPAFLVNEPKSMSPLAKSKKDNPELTERFHILIAGSEIGNGYSELNDSHDQRERFEKQQEMRNKGDDEAQMADYEFIEMLEHGMPPVCGFGFGERLFSVLMNKSIRECQTFPLMRPEEVEGKKKEKKKK
ncbi:MAG: lysine--tRNA ligase [Candidatus Pacearchaeota archaeon]|nr:lysine--tRNA ligase [Candidatus Pacearchaeota archaeon]